MVGRAGGVAVMHPALLKFWRMVGAMGIKGVSKQRHAMLTKKGTAFSSLFYFCRGATFMWRCSF